MDLPSFSKPNSFRLRRKFNYPTKPLSRGKIRLVTLLPGESSTIIKCQLSTKSLLDQPAYDALSYQWGLEGSERSILLDGKLFGVRINLLLALVYLRNLQEKRVFWIDAICINQDDKVEQSLQIEQMGKVYSQAMRVAVWLGPGNKDSLMALPFLHRLAEEDLNHETITSIFQEKKVKNQGIRLDLALRATLNGNPYWYRLWIIQEIFLARDAILHFGHETVSWATLGKALPRLRRYLEALPPKPDPLPHLAIGDLGMAVKYGGAAKMQLIKSISNSPATSDNVLRRLLGLAQRAECTKMQDRIYGLIGMTNLDIPVDYDKTISELYLDAMFHFRNALLQNPLDTLEMYTVKQSQILQALLKVSHSDRSPNSRKSAVKMLGIMSGEIRHIDGGYEGPMAQDPNTEPSSEEFRIDVNLRVKRLLQLYTGLDLHSFESNFERLIIELRYSPTRHLLDKCSPHHFQATIQHPKPGISIPDLTSQSISIPRGNVRPWFKRRLELKLFMSSLPGSLSDSFESDTTDSQLVGWVSPDARAGDHIVRFLESELCLVMRNTSSSGYEYVGCAIVPEKGDPNFDAETLEELSMLDCLTIWGSAPSYSQFQTALQNDRLGVEIDLDMETLQSLTCIKLVSG
jgi:hypothetical protein